MHIRDERVYKFCHELYPLILEADVYVGEMELHPVRKRHASPHYDMRGFFSPSVYDKVRNQLLKSFSVDIDRIGHLHPMMIISVISQTLLESDHAVSLDEHLWNYAQEQGKELQGLETVEKQMELLHTIEPGLFYKQIKDISSRPASLRSFTARALQYYVKGEIHSLYQLTKSSMHQLRKKIIYDRNDSMVKRIQGFDSSLSYFVTVGAGHLSGKNGMISKLRKSGWAVNASNAFIVSEE